MSFTAIRYELDGPEGARTATITLNRPEQLNAFDGEMRRDLMTALLQAQEEARALVLTGAGRGFCAGQDLGDMGQPEKVELERLLNEEYHPAIMALANCPIPTICAVNGVAAGAGANLALSADIVIAGRSARFLQAFARIGLMPDAGGTYWLPRLIGPQRAMALAMLAEPLPAETAAEWGLIWEVVADDALASHARALAHRLAAGPTEAYREMKRALRASPGNDFATQLALEAAAQDRLTKTRDFKEGVLSFLQKRAPDFEGR